MPDRLPLAAAMLGGVLRRSWPSYAVVFVTSRCNARCVFCFNWENVFAKEHAPEISVEQYRRLARSMKPLPQVVFSGGEPFLRRDLPEIVAAFHRDAGVRMVGIPTNAYLPGAVEESTRRILSTCPELSLNINLSIDGIDAKHDTVRGVERQFPKIIDTYERLDRLRGEFPNLMVNAQSVISGFNVDDIEDTILTLRRRMKLGFHSVGPVHGSTPEEGAHEITREQLRRAFDTADRTSLAGERRGPMERFAQAMVNRIRDVEMRAMASDKREFACLAGSKMVVVSHDGKVYPCEPLWLDDEQKRVFPQNAEMGDLRETDFDIRPILASQRAESIRADVAKKPCACMYSCAIYNGLLFAPSTYPGTVREFVKAWRTNSAARPEEPRSPAPDSENSA